MTSTVPLMIKSPIFWSLLVAVTAGTTVGRLTPNGSPWWLTVLISFVCAAIAEALERWYVTKRAKAMVQQGIADAAQLRPDLFR